MWSEITYLFINFNGATVESLGMDKQFHPTLFWACNYLSMLDLTMLLKGAIGNGSLPLRHQVIYYLDQCWISQNLWAHQNMKICIWNGLQMSAMLIEYQRVKLDLFWGMMKNTILSLHIDALANDCSISIANTLEILQSCTKPSICTSWINVYITASPFARNGISNHG